MHDATTTLLLLLLFIIFIIILSLFLLKFSFRTVCEFIRGKISITFIARTGYEVTASSLGLLKIRPRLVLFTMCVPIYCEYFCGRNHDSFPGSDTESMSELDMRSGGGGGGGTMKPTS